MNVLLSIKPKWAEKIYNGEKTIEFRKSIPKNFDISKDVVFIYETAPVKMVTGYIRISAFSKMNSCYLNATKKYNLFSKRYFEEKGKLNIDDLIKYANNKNLCCWVVNSSYKWNFEKIDRFSPTEKAPQSWCYTRAKFLGAGLQYDHKLKGYK